MKREDRLRANWPALLKLMTQALLPLAGTQGFAFSHGRAAVPEQFPQWNKHKQAAFHCWVHTASLPTPLCSQQRMCHVGWWHRAPTDQAPPVCPMPHSHTSWSHHCTGPRCAANPDRNTLFLHDYKTCSLRQLCMKKEQLLQDWVPEGTTRQLFRNLQRGLVCQKNPSYAAFSGAVEGTGVRALILPRVSKSTQHSAIPMGRHIHEGGCRVLHYLWVSFLKATSLTLKMWIKGHWVHACRTPHQAASAARQCSLISRRKRGSQQHAWSLRTQLQQRHFCICTALPLRRNNSTGTFTWTCTSTIHFLFRLQLRRNHSFCLTIVVW